MDGINRMSNKGVTAKHASTMDHRRVQKSATLNRRFVKRPNANGQIIAKTVEPKSVIGVTPAKKVVAAESQKVAEKPKMVASSARMTMGQKRGLLRKQQGAKVQPSKSFAVRRQGVIKNSDMKTVAKIAQKSNLSKKVSAKDVEKLERHPMASAARMRIQAKRNPVQPKILSAQEQKELAIQQALQRMASAESNQKSFGEIKAKGGLHFWQKKRFAVAMAMTLVSAGLLGYLVSLNLPDLSVRVVAMQTGISNAYPSYVPSNYRLDGMVKEENGKITMNFKNDIGKSFSLAEEKSSWNSDAVLANFVRKQWKNEYSIAKGQGLTIYVSGAKAAWVNGGVFYVIDGEAAELNSSDLHDIAVSL